MKKIIFIFLFVLLFLFGCSQKEDNNNKIDQENPPVDEPGEDNTGDDNIEDENPYGELIIPTLTIYTDFPDKPSPRFTKEEYSSEISYRVLYSPIISYQDGYFCATEEGSALVEATTLYHTTTFVVEAKKYISARGEDQSKSFLNRIAKVETKWLNEKVTGGTLFIGDSFFDPAQFFTNFYDLYKGENAYCHGISSSRIEDWYIFSKRLVYPVNPSNIVLHLGTNDMFSGKENPNDMLEEMKGLFNEYFERLPEVNIYWFAIEPRTYSINNWSSPFDTYTYNTINTMNLLMKEYCATDERLHYVDVSSKCYISGTTVDSKFFKDGVHPQLENYIHYCNALKEAGLGLKITEPETTTTALEFALDSSVSGSAKHILKENVTLTKNFSISGKVHITEIGNNPHLEFSFDSTHSKNRFLIWDNDKDGVFNLGYACDGTHKSKVNDVEIKPNIEFTFELIITEKHAYLYINGQLELVFRNINANFITFASANTKSTFKDLVIVTNNESAKWNNIISRTEISSEENNTITTKNVVVK